MGPISSEARLDAIDAGLRVLQADIEAAFLSDALDHLGEASGQGEGLTLRRAGWLSW